MSEEEVVKNYNSILRNAKANWIYEDYEILANFLDLYNKEKEKNIKLAKGIKILGTNPNLTEEEIIKMFDENEITEDYMEKFENNYIHKDKIRDKIKELEKDMVLPEARAILKELLEE